MLWLFLAPLALLLPGFSLAQSPSPEQIAREVRVSEEALARLREKAISVLDELQAAEDEVRALEEVAQKAEAETRVSSGRVAAAQREEDVAREALIAQLDELAPRLRARYELGKQRRANLLLSARSIGEMLWRQRALDRILEGDLELVGLARSAVGKLQERRARLEAVKHEHAQRAQSAAEKRARARKRKEEISLLHDSLMEQQDLKEKTLKELYRVQSELSRYVRGLPQREEEARPSRTGFSRRKGKMPFPTKGLIEVGFGKVLNPKFNTVTFQKGLDLRAPEGAEVTAVAPGKVVHAGPFRGYGNLIIVDHGEGYHSLYAHLGSLAKAVGEEVEEGAQLGTVGDTGSLKGSYLYFEIRESGKPVDPKSWLGAPP
ncbi:MAG: peptidoglycan DD-metalloendopeptidase family protein [Deltaproteobacteria bacterium]|nr:peptidoglycan DD-metalloendopeptidase family protein [Deltaproteobacteria bacterium]